MARDYRKLLVFRFADVLVVDVYPATGALPIEERFGLQSQMRRAAVSVLANFVSIALRSANEIRYVLGLCVRFGYLDHEDIAPLTERYSQLIGSRTNVVASLENSTKSNP